MSSAREVPCTVPVYVSIENGRITRVVVDDEDVRLDEEVPPDVLEISRPKSGRRGSSVSEERR